MIAETKKRRTLEKGFILRLGETDYTISEVMGCGSNAIVYRASYRDNLLEDRRHAVLIKELFPLRREGGIERGEDQKIHITSEDALAYFTLHRRSFERGNAAHIQLEERRPDKVSGNIQSFERNNTLYTLLNHSGGKTLAGSAADGTLANLRSVTVCMIRILDALKVFHENGMLHLDVSPDNILLLPLDEGQDEFSRNVLLIDYNSVWSMEDFTRPQQDGFTYSVKEPYSAPEVRLREVRSIGPATDLFSICMIFAECVQKERFDPENLMRGKMKPLSNAASPLLEKASASSTVLQKINFILRKGLSLSHTRRFQSAGALQGEFRELLNRIDGVGVTHSALWEASACGFRAAVGENPSFSYLKDAASFSREKLDPTFYEHRMIVGDGGMGKTTALLHLWKDGVQKYSPSDPVPLYVPLHPYQQGARNFIKRSVLEKLKFDPSISNIGEALRVLKDLLNKPAETKEGSLPAVLLLLDGLNEIGGNAETLFQEIEELSGYRGLSMVLTSRADSGDVRLRSFRRVTLPPLSPDEIRTFFSARNLPYPDENSDKNFLRLLTNPLTLTLYAKTCELQGNGDISLTDPETLLRMYLKSLLTAMRPRREGERTRARFSVEILLPHIARVMAKKRKQALTPEEILNILETWRSRVVRRQKSFLRAFPEYIENASEIFGGAEQPSSWVQATVAALLKDRFALLWRDEHLAYHLPHENFREPLSARSRANEKKFRRAEFRQTLPRFAGALTLAASLSVAAFHGISRYNADGAGNFLQIPIPPRSLRVCVQGDSAADEPLVSELTDFLQNSAAVSYDVTGSPRDSQVFLRVAGSETSPRRVRITYPGGRGDIYDYAQESRDVPLDKEGIKTLELMMERLAKLLQLENMRLPRPDPGHLTVEYKLYAPLDRREWEELPEAEGFIDSFGGCWKLTRTEPADTRDIRLRSEEKMVILRVSNRSLRPFYIYAVNATPGAEIIPFLLPAEPGYSTELKPGDRRDFEEIPLEFTEQREYLRIIASARVLDVRFFEELGGAEALRGRPIVAAGLISDEAVSQVNFFLRE